MIKKICKRCYVRLLMLFYYVKGKYSNRKEKIIFITHQSMSRDDLYDVKNYRSDSALTFLHYILSNNLLFDKSIYIGVTPSAIEM